MGLSVISNNTTTKNVVLPSGAYTFPTNASTDLFTVPTGACYEINAICFSAISGTTVVPYIKNPSGTVYNLSGDVKNPTTGSNVDWADYTGAGSASGSGSSIIATPKSAPTVLNFRNGLRLSEGYSFGFTVTGAGGAQTYGCIGRGTVNTP